MNIRGILEIRSVFHDDFANLKGEAPFCRKNLLTGYLGSSLGRLNNHFVQFFRELLRVPAYLAQSL